MKDALNGHRKVVAGPDAPAEAKCPECEGRVVLRRRGETWFYRHKRGEGPGCPRRVDLLSGC